MLRVGLLVLLGACGFTVADDGTGGGGGGGGGGGYVLVWGTLQSQATISPAVTAQ